MKKIGIAAGGPTDLWPDKLPIVSHWIGVDRGTIHLMAKGIVPDIAVGDFDSLSEPERVELKQQIAKVVSSHPEKDDTDTELAMEIAVNNFPDCSYELIGATGGRIDHLLSNLWLPLENRFMDVLELISIKDNQNTISYFKPGKHVVHKELDKKYLGFICLTEVKGLTLMDSKYTLTNYDVEATRIFGSNEFINETVSFEFKSGILAVIQSKDK